MYHYGSCFTFGFAPFNGALFAVSGTNLNNAGYFPGMGFYTTEDKTLNSVRIFCANKVGTVGTSDIELHIYDDSSGSPGTSQASSATCSPAVGASTWVEFSGFSFSMTAYTKYWIVIKNVNGVPASNYIRVDAFTSNFNHGMGYGMSGGAPYLNHGSKTSVNGGSSWSVQNYGTYQYVLKFSDTSYMGNVGQSVLLDNTNAVYSTRKVGNLWTSPPCKLVLKYIKFTTTKVGTPTGNLRAEVFKDTTSVGTSIEIPPASVSSVEGSIWFNFTTPIALSPNTQYRIVMSESTQSDASTDKYRPSIVVHETNTSYPLCKLGSGKLKMTYYNGSSWSETEANVVEMLLVCDPVNNFVIPIGTSVS